MLAMQPFFNLNFGNASSDHRNGWSTKEAVEMAREKIARLINASVNDIFFTSGATEAINMALFGLTEPGDEISTCKTEHKAVLETCAELEQRE